MNILSDPSKSKLILPKNEESGRSDNANHWI